MNSTEQYLREPFMWPPNKTALDQVIERREDALAYLPESLHSQAKALGWELWEVNGGRPRDSLKIAIAITLEESRV